ncbi:MAG: T9SS type A sorting domain-containing protein, partial [Bacteroidales bacterium]|nr:T9SS type A sorting domain-containing protein [Bacteroidales bacterium]
VYPNPTLSEFHIEIAEPALLEVFTITGHLVFQKNATPGVHTFKPERSGLYLIRLSSGKRSTVLRAVKR